jgi:hypothetical protein
MFKYSKHMQAIQFLVGNIGGKKTKERFETILEPLQAIIQIACLAYYPIGSKLAIHNNILIIQHPGYTQNVKRWYNNDKKEDVFYLYNVFSRFNKFYKNVLARGSSVSGSANTNGSEASSVVSYAEYTNSQLFALLHDLAKTGINNLIRTYNQTDKIHILHTLQMYKGMLDSPELVRRLSNDGGGGGAGAGAGARNHGHSNNTYASASAEDDAKSAAKFINDHDERDLPRQFPLMPMSASSSASSASSHPAGHSTPLDNLMDNSNSHIDSLFIKITDLYSQDDFDIIYHTLMKVQNDTLYFTNYVDGLNKILEPVNIRIKKWIDDNIVF